MSTRSAILQKTENGYRGIYCHFDGYEEGVGATLLEHYQDEDKITRLLDLGSISSLDERVEPVGKHSYDIPEKGTTIAYHRDRGEKEQPAIEGPTVEAVAPKIGHNGYVYVWEDGEWTVNGQSLAEALVSEDEEDKS